MNEKKLAALHSHFTSLGVKLPSLSDFINSMKDERNAKDFFDTFDAQGAFDVDYDTFKSIYGIGAAPVSNGLAGRIMDFGASVLREQKKVPNVYQENVPQIQEKFNAQGEPQNLQAVMSPNNPKLKELHPKTGDLDVDNVPIAQIDYYGNATNIDRPKDAAAEFFETEETDPLKVSMEKYAEQKDKTEWQTEWQKTVEKAF